MGVARCDNVDQIDVVPCDQFPPIGLVGRKTELFRGGLDLVLGPAAERLKHWFDAQLGEKLGQLAVGVAVGLPHELVPDQTNPNLTLR